ncbi:hypothetical protein H671_8g19054 [Cricetulus griseus]|nr:hypothetical protein H671_8g19054 [Cricetulus griseus]
MELSLSVSVDGSLGKKALIHSNLLLSFTSSADQDMSVHYMRSVSTEAQRGPQNHWNWVLKTESTFSIRA